MKSLLYLIGFRAQHQLNENHIIALLPEAVTGNRTATAMLSVTEQFPDQQFVVAAAPGFPVIYYQQFIGAKM
ncbi:hypothetical protein CS542_03685 [Pedobacter sp. IW39]|nr:hypothetical protein CS542_03685 [Pedobacter sp. IW39]